MKKIWIFIGLSSSSFGNFCLSVFALSFSQSATSFSEFAIAFTFYTILITFFRPLVCDALINKDLHAESNNREFLLDALIVSILFSLFSFILYFNVSSLQSSALLTVIIFLPALLMHDSLRYKFLSNNSNKDSAILDIFWSSSFILLTTLLFFIGINTTINLLVVWAAPTCLTTFYGSIKLLLLDSTYWKKSWLISTRHIWIPNFKDFIYGQGVIQGIFLLAITFLNPDSIASFRIAITMLFPLTLIQSSNVLSFFNYGNMNFSQTFNHFNTLKMVKVRKQIFLFSLLYSFFIFTFSEYIIQTLTKFDTILDRSIIVLCSFTMLITIPQIDIINRFRKRNDYHGLVRIRRNLLPILLILSVFFAYFLNFHGLLTAIIIYQLILSFKLLRASERDTSVRSIGIVSEYDSGGAFLAAKNQFEVYLQSSQDPVFYIPNSVELYKSLPYASKQNFGKIEYLKFPSTIFRITQVLPFLRDFRKSWIRTGRPQLFAHGIRSGFLVALCTFSKPLILIHRNIDQGLPYLTRSLLRVHRIYCRKLMSVSPVSKNMNSIEFYPILSPLLSDYTDIERSSNRTQNFPLRILWIARLDFPKLPEVLLSALQYVPASQYICRMVGVGPKRSNCQEIARRLNLKVEFVEQSSTLRELEQSDLVILLSDFEGVPFALQEALAAKVPVIASRLPGIEFLGGKAFIYANNEKEVLEAILKCLNVDYYNEVFEINRKRWDEIKMVFNKEWKLPNKQTSGND